MASMRLLRLTLAVALCASCAGSDATSPSSTLVPTASMPTLTVPPLTVLETVASTVAPVDAVTTTEVSANVVMSTVVTQLGPWADITTGSVPADVLVPTSPETLNPQSNPINGRRGAGRPDPSDDLAVTLDLLGFAVGTATDPVHQRAVSRSMAVLQLDAGLVPTGQMDDSLYAYMFGADVGAPAGPGLRVGADEYRQIGVSAGGRSIVAERYGSGSRVVLVVGQTHGDEEAGLRVLLRARTMLPLDNVTMWIVPTMNPDGGAKDSRFLADGSDPNRRAPSAPEQVAVYDFAIEVRPQLTVWYHQNYAWVGGSGASIVPAQEYQTVSQLEGPKRSGDCAKEFMWCPIDEVLGSSSILVELPDVATPDDVHRNADALIAVASGA